MTVRVNGSGASGQKLTGGLDYFTLTTTVNITPTGVVAKSTTYGTISGSNTVKINGVTYDGTLTNATSDYDAARAAQTAFDKIIEIISTRGQPVIMGLPAWNGSSAYVFRWAGEHRDAWYNLTQFASDTTAGGDATHTPLTIGGVYTPAVPVVAATHPYDAAPDLVTLIKALGSTITQYPGTPDSEVITFKDHAVSTVSFATATTLTVTNSL
jgi:hypothetical protein